MEIENDIIECHFSDIYMAGVFAYNNHYYMRIMASQLCETCKYNAVDIEEGSLHYFNLTDTVAELSGSFHVR